MQNRLKKLTILEIHIINQTFINKIILIRFENDMIGKLDYIINQKLAPYRPYKTIMISKEKLVGNVFKFFDPDRGNFAK
jgi:hypothetical protein